LTRLLSWLWYLSRSLALGLALIGAVLYVRFLTRGPELETWHSTHLSEEYQALDSPDVGTLAEYARLEERLFAELESEVYRTVDAADRVPFNRYNAGSRSDPQVWSRNWNRSFDLGPRGDSAPAAVLLLHGLSDSPYSLRSVGEHLAARGLRVVGLRLPGHGTAPSGLLDFRVEDMLAVTRMAMLDLRRQLPAGAPLYIVGYSNGAALAIHYSLDQIEAPDRLPRAEKLILISPAIGISPLAMIARVRTGLSSVPGLERAAWQQIDDEVDPFKYSSFSFNAAGQVQRLTSDLGRRVADAARRSALDGFPPVLAFISTVDATVRVDAVVDALFEHLVPRGHELVLFDVNRHAGVRPLLVRDPGPLTRRVLAMPTRPFALSIVTNVNPRTFEVKELHSASGSSAQTARLLGLRWPAGVYSLSHLALPFPPDDPLYGYEAASRTDRIQLGRIELRGENGVLAVPAWLMTRQRSNPFHGYLLERIDDFIGPARSSPQAHATRPPAPGPARAGTPPST
jgi:alpha-beta hydrolase superfamily lysophospholipase